MITNLSTLVRHRYARGSIVLACLASLAACGGGGGGSAPSTAAVTPTPSADLAPTQGASNTTSDEPSIISAEPFFQDAVAAPAAAPAAVVAAVSSPVPDYRVPKENWTAAKTLVSNDSSWASWKVNTQSQLDTWITKSPEKASLIAGWMHNYVNPTTNLPMTWTPTSPEPTDTTSALHGAWVAYMRTYNVARIVDAAKLYKLTNDSKYANWAIAQLDLYTSAYNSWPLNTWGGKARMMNQSLDEATAVLQLVEAVRTLGTSASTSKRSSWYAGLFQPLANNLTTTDLGLMNISVWLASAVTTIGLEFNDSSLVDTGMSGARGVTTLLANGITADGLWLESSFGYNQYVIKALQPLFVTAGLKGQISLVASAVVQARRLLTTPYQMVFDDGTLPNPSDSTWRFTADDAALHLAAYRVMGSRTGLLAARSNKNWDTLLDPTTTDTIPSATVTPVVTKNFDSLRKAVLKNSNWQSFLNYGQLTDRHAQAEALNTEVYYRAVPITQDAGTVSYGSTYHTQYFSKGMAHNVPLVDGEGQVGWAPGTISAFDAATGTPSISASQPNYRADAEASKNITLTSSIYKETMTLKMIDASVLNHRLGFMFNTKCAVTLPSPGVSSAAPAGTGSTFLTSVTKQSFSNRVVTTLTCGTSNFKATFTLNGSGNLYAGKAPDTPLPKTRNFVYVELTGRDATYSVEITPI